MIKIFAIWRLGLFITNLINLCKCSEFVKVIKNNKEKKYNEKKIVNKIKKYLNKYSLKDTVDLILETEKLNKKEIYQLCLEIKKSEIY